MKKQQKQQQQQRPISWRCLKFTIFDFFIKFLKIYNNQLWATIQLNIPKIEKN